MDKKFSATRNFVLGAALVAAGLSSAYAEDKVKVGLMLPYTGTYAALGNAITNGFKQFVEENGGKLGGTYHGEGEAIRGAHGHESARHDHPAKRSDPDQHLLRRYLHGFRFGYQAGIDGADAVGVFIGRRCSTGLG